MSNSTALNQPSQSQDDELENEVLNQYVTFQLGQEAFGVTMNDVQEIIRMPDTIKVPMTTVSLVGLSNLRGNVLPILDLRKVLQFEEVSYNDATRVVVTNTAKPVGLVVDSVNRVLEVDEDQIESSDGADSSLEAQFLDGVIKSDADTALIQLLDVAGVIDHEFNSDTFTSNGDNPGLASVSAENAETGGAEEDEDMDQLVTFSVDAQEYAFNLEFVQEIIRIPESISKVPLAKSHVMGLIDLRDSLLPLVSLRRLFEMSESSLGENNRILVVTLTQALGIKHSVGLVVDDVKEVLRISDELQDKIPSLLADEDGNSDIKSICRLDDGDRLISVLEPESLFSHPAIKSALENNEAEETEQVNDDIAQEDSDDTAQLVVFLLGEQEYGVSIDDIQEITRIPEKLDKVPKTEDFIDGVFNLRGVVLPVLDMRTRFDLNRMDSNERQRIIVFNLEGIRTGFIVDSVVEVLRLPLDQIEASPELSGDQTRIMGEIVNMKDKGRIIQVLTAKELLSSKEVSQIEEEIK